MGKCLPGVSRLGKFEDCIHQKAQQACAGLRLAAVAHSRMVLGSIRAIRASSRTDSPAFLLKHFIAAASTWAVCERCPFSLPPQLRQADTICLFRRGVGEGPGSGIAPLNLAPKDVERDRREVPPFVILDMPRRRRRLLLSGNPAGNLRVAGFDCSLDGRGANATRKHRIDCWRAPAAHLRNSCHKLSVAPVPLSPGAFDRSSGGHDSYGLYRPFCLTASSL